MTAVLTAFIVPLAIYVATLRPGVDFWDTGDLQTVPYILGIPYPTGYPAYVLIGWAWTHLVPLGDVAWRMNALSAVALSAGAATVVAGAMALGAAPEVAAVGALLGALAHPVWQMADHADAHAVGAAATVAALAAALGWWRTGDRRALGASAAVAGLAVAIDASTLLALSGVALVAIARPPSLRRALFAAALAAAIGAGFYAYLPLRSAVLSAQHADPTLALGLAPGRPFWDDHHTASWSGFRSEVTGSDFQVGAAVTSLFAPATLIDAGRMWYPRVRRDFAYGSFALALLGLGLATLRAPLAGAGLLLTPALPVLFALAYRDEAQVERYFVVGDLVSALLLAYGVHRALTIVDAAPRRLVAAIALALLAGVGAHEVANASDLIDQRNDRTARAWLDRVRAGTPNDAIIVAPWAYATPLAYGAYVERTLGARTIVVGWPGDFSAEAARWAPARPVVFVIETGGTPPVIAAQRLQQLDIGEPELWSTAGRRHPATLRRNSGS